jgi:hypothetical protein
MSVIPAVPCRLSVLMARRAEVAVILRRGPARWVELILWDTKKDRFQRGQWFHGKIYDERCDISPDGTKFIYFAAKYGKKWDADMPDTWTAISKPPYFTALALWPNGGTYGGGGLFLDDQCFWHADWNPIRTGFSLKGLTEVSDATAGVGFDEKFRDDRMYLRLQHTGWEVIEQQKRLRLKWKKAAPVRKGELLLDRTLNTPRYFLILPNEQTKPQPLDAQWADWDNSGRLVIAHQGKILAGKWDRRHGLRFEELADLNGDQPVGLEAPEWARRW